MTPARLRVPVSPRDHTRGDLDRPFTLIEYQRYDRPRSVSIIAAMRIALVLALRAGQIPGQHLDGDLAFESRVAHAIALPHGERSLEAAAVVVQGQKRHSESWREFKHRMTCAIDIASRRLHKRCVVWNSLSTPIEVTISDGSGGRNCSFVVDAHRSVPGACVVIAAARG